MSIWKNFIAGCFLSIASLGVFAQQLLTPVAVTASSQANPATYATDNNTDTYWSSGRVPEQWIELDFQKAWYASSISVTVAQTGPGYAFHKVMGRTERGEWVNLLEGGMYFTDRQVLNIGLAGDKLPVRYVRITTTQSVSIVGWRDIKIYGTEVPRPKNKGDVVGRDLSMPVLGAAGHIGLWDGRRVLEVLDEPTVVQQNAIEDFVARSKYWGPVYTNIPTFSVKSCFLRTCDFWDPPRGGGANDRVTLGTREAIVARGEQIMVLGASYTTRAYPISAEPQMYDRATKWYRPARRGEYRCDSFVRELFGWTNSSAGNYFVFGTGTYSPVERVIWNDPQWWRDKTSALFSGVQLPSATYSKLKAF